MIYKWYTMIYSVQVKSECSSVNADHRNWVHDDVIKWKHFPRYWPFVRGIHRPHKGQWRGALKFSVICIWINGWVKNHEAGDLRRYRAHYDVIVMVGMGWPELGPSCISWITSGWRYSYRRFSCLRCSICEVTNQRYRPFNPSINLRLLGIDLDTEGTRLMASMFLR